MVDKYEVLIPCKSDKTGNSFRVGDIIAKREFPAKVIKGWLAKNPPVLKVVKDGSDG